MNDCEQFIILVYLESIDAKKAAGYMTLTLIKLHQFKIQLGSWSDKGGDC